MQSNFQVFGPQYAFYDELSQSVLNYYPSSHARDDGESLRVIICKSDSSDVRKCNMTPLSFPKCDIRFSIS